MNFFMLPHHLDFPTQPAMVWVVSKCILHLSPHFWGSSYGNLVPNIKIVKGNRTFKKWGLVDSGLVMGVLLHEGLIFSYGSGICLKRMGFDKAG